LRQSNAWKISSPATDQPCRRRVISSPTVTLRELSSNVRRLCRCVLGPKEGCDCGRRSVERELPERRDGRNEPAWSGNLPCRRNARKRPRGQRAEKRRKAGETRRGPKRMRPSMLCCLRSWSSTGASYRLPRKRVPVIRSAMPRNCAVRRLASAPTAKKPSHCSRNSEPSANAEDGVE